MSSASSPGEARQKTDSSPWLAVVNPHGRERLVRIHSNPFRIGRLPDCDLRLDDQRISRKHALIVTEQGEYFLEDWESRSGVFVNGRRITRHKLEPNDRVDFGIPDSYSLLFTYESHDASWLKNQLETVPSTGSGLLKLQAVLQVSLALESSLSFDDILAFAVDVALEVTGYERGFLLLRSGGGRLEMRVARDRRGGSLPPAEGRVPTGLIERAIEERRFLAQSDAIAASASTSATDLGLRSVLCVPLLRIRFGATNETTQFAPAPVLGALYMDSREKTGTTSTDPELLRALAAEVAAVLEMARLMSQEREQRRMHQELAIAREMQRSLLQVRLPTEGWLTLEGSTRPCLQVGGDFYDVARISEDRWSAVMADVSGKGFSAALLASLLQGAFSVVTGLARAGHGATLPDAMALVNQYIWERSHPRHFATVFYCNVSADGVADWVNAGHCPPVVVRSGGSVEILPSASVPVGFFETVAFSEQQTQLHPGDKIVVYTDGVTEAESESGQQFGLDRLLELAATHARSAASDLHAVITGAVDTFTGGAPQVDDITLLVLEYRGSTAQD